MPVPLIVGLVLGLVSLAVVSAMMDGTVSWARLERFARRHRLRITVDNGNQVIRYLATTRRWRVAGFLAGLGLSQIGTPAGTIIQFNAVAVFFGWFLGALVAEARVAHLAHGSVRMASLVPRRPQRYLHRYAWSLVPAAAAISVVIGVITALADALRVAEPDWWRAGWSLSGALALAAVVRMVQLRVLARPQPLAAPDIIDADDAIRSRSLHVLSGGGAALVLFLALGQLGAIHPSGTLASDLLETAGLLGIFVVAAAGWLVATSLWPLPGGPYRSGKPSVGPA